MSLGYFGYAKLLEMDQAEADAIFLLTNTGGLNREVAPILSTAVWGAGWYTAAQHTNYADSQMNFSGSLTFELQGVPNVWNMITGWLINRRIDPKTLIVSPNGLVVQSYVASMQDTTGGAWLNTAAFTIDPAALVSLNCNVIAIKRTETYTVDKFAPSPYRSIRVGPGHPTAPLNPYPYNRNPFPGWSAQTEITWPGAPPYFSPTDPTGMFLMSGNWTFNNNTQIIRGCTGQPHPAAIMQGVMHVDGSLTMFRDGVIEDPYNIPGQPFSASGAHLKMSFGSAADGPIPIINIKYVLLTSDEFSIQGQNNPVSRTFGFAGLGDGFSPPMEMLPM